MSAYRELSAADLDALCRLAGARSVISCRPITAGIENSNWFVDLDVDGHPQASVLTLVESVPADELPFFITLADTLAVADLPVPVPRLLAGGRRQFMLQGRPAILVPRLPGDHADVPTHAQCEAAGTMLARLHAAAARCPLVRERPDHRWWPTAFAYVAPGLARVDHDELAAALLDASRVFAHAHALPHGTIHGDFFRDNVLLAGDEVSGVLDFFHATRDLLAWDMAIALNDWAVVGGVPDASRAEAFLAGHARVRPLRREEEDLLPALRRAAAARFWLSRLVAAEKQSAFGNGAIQRKDPGDMRALLRALS